MHIIPRVIFCSEGLDDVFIKMKDLDVRTNSIMGSGKGWGYESLFQCHGNEKCGSHMLHP
jgi:hypothetical protein